MKSIDKNYGVEPELEQKALRTAQAQCRHNINICIVSHELATIFLCLNSAAYHFYFIYIVVVNIIRYLVGIAFIKKQTKHSNAKRGNC